MENNEKIVDFENYCKLCKHAKLAEKLDPCDECLTNPVNTNSCIPVLFEEA